MKNSLATTAVICFLSIIAIETATVPVATTLQQEIKLETEFKAIVASIQTPVTDVIKELQKLDDSVYKTNLTTLLPAYSDVIGEFINSVTHEIASYTALQNPIRKYMKSLTPTANGALSEALNRVIAFLNTFSAAAKKLDMTPLPDLLRKIVPTITPEQAAQLNTIINNIKLLNTKSDLRDVIENNAVAIRKSISYFSNRRVNPNDTLQKITDSINATMDNTMLALTLTIITEIGSNLDMLYANK